MYLNTVKGLRVQIASKRIHGPQKQFSREIHNGNPRTIIKRGKYRALLSKSPGSNLSPFYPDYIRPGNGNVPIYGRGISTVYTTVA